MRCFFTAVLATSLLSLTACSSSTEQKGSDKNVLINNDFESLEGWVSGENTKTLTKEQAHSGQFAVKVGPGAEYGIGYTNQIGKLSATKFTKFQVSAWAWLPNDQATPALVLELKNPVSGASLLWNKIELNKEKAYGRWVKVEQELDLPAEADYATQLTLYGWAANSPAASYIDDIQVAIVH